MPERTLDPYKTITSYKLDGPTGGVIATLTRHPDTRIEASIIGEDWDEAKMFTRYDRAVNWVGREIGRMVSDRKLG